MSVIAIIPAAGSGSRMGNATPKPFLPIQGIPIIIHTLRCFDAATSIDEVVIAVSESLRDSLVDLIQSHGIRKVTQVVNGGAERQDSVRLGFEACDADLCEVVVVHDAARPLVSPSEINEVVAAAQKNGAAILGAPLKETIKQVDAGRIQKTIDRSQLWGAQTPQAFRYEIFAQAVAQAMSDNFLGTDDASLVERIGAPITMVRGSYRNIKVTTPEDIEIAALWLAKEKR